MTLRLVVVGLLMIAPFAASPATALDCMEPLAETCESINHVYLECENDTDCVAVVPVFTAGGLLTPDDPCVGEEFCETKTLCGFAPLNCVTGTATVDPIPGSCQANPTSPPSWSNCRATFQTVLEAHEWLLPGTMTTTLSSGSCSWGGITGGQPGIGCTRTQTWNVVYSTFSIDRCETRGGSATASDGVNAPVTVSVDIQGCWKAQPVFG